MRQATVFFWFSKQGLQGWWAFIRLGPSYQSQAHFPVLHREWVVSLHANPLLVLLRWGHWLGKLGGYWTWLCEPVHDLDNGQGFGCRFHNQKASCSPWARTSSPHVRKWSLETHTFIYAWESLPPFWKMLLILYIFRLRVMWIPSTMLYLLQTLILLIIWKMVPQLLQVRLSASMNGSIIFGKRNKNQTTNLRPCCVYGYATSSSAITETLLAAKWFPRSWWLRVATWSRWLCCSSSFSTMSWTSFIPFRSKLRVVPRWRVPYVLAFCKSSCGSVLRVWR